MTGSRTPGWLAWLGRQTTPVYWREAGLCVPAMPLLLVAGIALGQPVFGAVAAGAAFSVGFGAARDLRGRRWGAMAAATFGVSLATLIGCLVGQSLPVLMAISAAAALGCAILALFDEDLWWVTLQIVIALLVAGYYASPPALALQRAGAVLAGGMAQIVIVMILARLFPKAAARLPAGPPKPPPSRSLVIGHAVRAAACVAGALWAARMLGISNNYWAPMTAMIVLKPGLSETQVRGVARLLGTLIGCVLATAFAMAVGENPPVIVVGMAVTAGAAFALQKAHYATLTCAITATVVLLLTLGKGAPLLNAEHRLIATALGGAIALIVARIAPHRALTADPDGDRVGA